MSQPRLTDRNSQWVRRNYNKIKDIPRREEGEWASQNLPNSGHTVIRALIERGLITQTGTEMVGSGRQRHTRNLYTTSPVLDAIRDDIKGPRTLPCGHTGFHTLGNDEYECGADHCTTVFDRETVEAAYTNGGDP